MVNNGERTLNDLYKLDVTNIKIHFTPTKNDICSKNPNRYWKTCFDCRVKKKAYMDQYYKRKNN
jgi:hypothetical protein